MATGKKSTASRSNKSVKRAGQASSIFAGKNSGANDLLSKFEKRNKKTQTRVSF